MNPLEQIDNVFFWIKEKAAHGGYYGYYYIENFVRRMPEWKINPTMLKEILALLVEDGYITERKITPGAALPVYNVTFKGIIFEGYVKAKENTENEAEWQRNIAALTVDNARSLNRLTLWLAIFTGVAAFYYGVELYKFFCLGIR